MSDATVADVDVGVAADDRDLEQILALQRRSLVPGEDGFVTVRHSLDGLRALHAAMPSVVARHRGEVAGRSYVMGQVCVDPSWRGRGLFDRLYAEHRARYADRFEWLVTEIAMRNPRSRKAHARVGFVEIDHYRDDTDEWSVVGWCFATGP
jgi:GNAT superfamily N-acetyltransferase